MLYCQKIKQLVSLKRLLWIIIERKLVAMKNQNTDSTQQPRGFGLNIINHPLTSNNPQNSIPKTPFNKVHPLSSKTSSQTTMDIEVQLLPSCQSEAYAHEINLYIFSRVSFATEDYFPSQPEISTHMRGILLNWLVNVHLKYQLSAETLFLSVDILDQFLSKQKIVKKELQLLGITALWIAAKYHQVYQVPKMSNLVYISDNAYTKKDILEMESKIMKSISFNLLQNNLNTYIELILKKVKMEAKDQNFARYFSELCLVDWSVRRKDQKVLSAGIIYLIKRMRKQAVFWGQELIEVTGVSEANAKHLAKQLYIMLFGVGNNPYFNSIRNKYSSQKYDQVGKISIKHRSQ